MTVKERWLAATPEERLNWEYPAQRPEKIASHSGWYRGSWEIDTCHCGQKIRVPQGTKGQYQCNDCADRAEGGGY